MSATKAIMADNRRLRHGSLAAVVAVHALVFWGLMQAAQLPQRPSVLTVDLIHPPEAAPRPANANPPRPQPVERRSAPQPAPQTVAVAAPEAAPAPPAVAVPSAPASVEPSLPSATPPAPLAQPAAASPASPAPVQTVEPRFDADYLLNPKPPYPSLSRRMGEEGRVVLRVYVRADGLVEEVRLTASSGSARLDQSALDTVRRWKFVPARRGDEAVAAWVLVPIVFSLKE